MIAFSVFFIYMVGLNTVLKMLYVLVVGFIVGLHF